MSPKLPGIQFYSPEIVTLFWEDDNGHLILLRMGFKVANLVSYCLQLCFDKYEFEWNPVKPGGGL